MADWKPLSKRDDPAALAQLAEPVDGIPPWLAGPLGNWIRLQFTTPGGVVRDAEIGLFEMRYRLNPPLPKSNKLPHLIERTERMEMLALDVIDYLLHYCGTFRHSRPAPATAVNYLLREGGSAWEAAPVGGDHGSTTYQLIRRASGPIREAMVALPPENRATIHLTTAWNRLAGREPDVSVAYREAIRAVEAAAKPVVLPNNPKVTLGTMIAALRDKPEKWTTTIGTVESVRLMMEAVWKGQLDRHGTDDEAVPLNVSAGEADAAVTTCITLVRLFVGGHIRALGVDPVIA